PQPFAAGGGPPGPAALRRGRAAAGARLRGVEAAPGRDPAGRPPCGGGGPGPAGPALWRPGTEGAGPEIPPAAAAGQKARARGARGGRGPGPERTPDPGTADRP